MSNHASEIILLCEDSPQERLAREYLKKCGAKDLEHVIRPRVGGGFTRVLDQFPQELRACRTRHAKTLLIVIIDADQLSVEKRRKQLLERAKAAGLDDPGSNEPVSILVPKRNIETWLKALLGSVVNEEDDYKNWKKLSKDDYRTAASVLFDWSRPNATPASTIIGSLQQALPVWNKIG